MADASSWLVAAFETAKRDFIRDLKNPFNYNFQQFSSVQDVYDTAEQIQAQQSRNKTLLGLKKIEPLIQCLEQYASTIEVFVQVKPEILGLIWV